MACAALKGSTGGWLHIHGNVSTYHHAGVDEAKIPWSSREREGERKRHGRGGERNPWEMTAGRNPCYDSDDLSGGM